MVSLRNFDGCAAQAQTGHSFGPVLAWFLSQMPSRVVSTGTLRSRVGEDPPNYAFLYFGPVHRRSARNEERAAAVRPVLEIPLDHLPEGVANAVVDAAGAALAPRS
jgi:hypothetical protein